MLGVGLGLRRLVYSLGQNCYVHLGHARKISIHRISRMLVKVICVAGFVADLFQDLTQQKSYESRMTIGESELLMRNRNIRRFKQLTDSTQLTERRLSSRVSLTALVALMMLLSACSAQPTHSAALDMADAVTLAALPAGIGRGFPTAQIDSTANSSAGLQEGKEPPNFRLILEDGRHISLEDLRGRPILINFWATWCGPCRLEMPDIVAVAQANPDLIVLAVNVQETMEQIQPFAEEFQMTLPIVRDTDGELRTLYAVRGMPTSVFIDRQGKIFTIWTGMLTADLIQEIVADIG